jgi:hypothetical protein
MRAHPVLRAYTISAWIAVTLMLVPAATAAQMAGRVALNPSTVAHHEFISISDLLPPEAPEEMRARAAALTLGEAPLPGAHRIFARAQVERALRAVPELRSALAIPPSIQVTRWSRPLTREEVLAAIVAALGSNQLTNQAPLPSRDLVFNSNVVVTEAAPKLRVTRIEHSPDRAETHVRLLTASEPRSPSFWVTLLLNLDADGPAESAHPADLEAAHRILKTPHNQRRVAIRDGQPSATEGSILVRTGDRVQLIVQTQGMRLSAKATSLDIGCLGQRIRVRNSDTGKVLSGTIVAAHTIKADI